MTLERIVNLTLANKEELEESYKHNISLSSTHQPEWEEFGIILKFFPSGGGLSGSFGYLFDPSGTSYPTVAPDDNSFEEAAAAYERSIRPPSGEIMKRMLIQYNRRTGKFQAEFEYEDETRWQIKPSNLETSIAALRPVWD